MNVTRCASTVTLKSGESVQCTITWVDEDASLIHKAGTHSGTVLTASNREAALLWSNEDADTP